MNTMYTNEFKATEGKHKQTYKLKAGRGEFYGGNQVHITEENDRQSEKNKYTPFNGTGNNISIITTNTRSIPHVYSRVTYKSQPITTTESKSDILCISLGYITSIAVLYIIQNIII
jgi:hypothetical protein